MNNLLNDNSKKISEDVNIQKKKEEVKKIKTEDLDEIEKEDDDEELVENRAKPIIVVRLKRFDAPLTRRSLLQHKDELTNYDSDCILMRDDENDTNLAICFFGKPFDQLMNLALETLKEWEEEEEEKITPVIDILTGIECYNCDLDNATLRKAAYFIINAYGEETDEIMDSFPISDSLVRIIRVVKGNKTVKDVLAYPDWSTLDDDDDGWVDRMIKEHDINL